MGPIEVQEVEWKKGAEMFKTQRNFCKVLIKVFGSIIHLSSLGHSSFPALPCLVLVCVPSRMPQLLVFMNGDSDFPVRTVLMFVVISTPRLVTPYFTGC